MSTTASISHFLVMATLGAMATPATAGWVVSGGTIGVQRVNARAFRASPRHPLTQHYLGEKTSFHLDEGGELHVGEDPIRQLIAAQEGSAGHFENRELIRQGVSRPAVSHEALSLPLHGINLLLRPSDGQVSIEAPRQLTAVTIFFKRTPADVLVVQGIDAENPPPLNELIHEGRIWTHAQQVGLIERIVLGGPANGVSSHGASITRVDPYVWMKSYRIFLDSVTGLEQDRHEVVVPIVVAEDAETQLLVHLQLDRFIGVDE
jgi:hypothetical protein